MNKGYFEEKAAEARRDAMISRTNGASSSIPDTVRAAYVLVTESAEWRALICILTAAFSEFAAEPVPPTKLHSVKTPLTPVEDEENDSDD